MNRMQYLLTYFIVSADHWDFDWFNTEEDLNKFVEEQGNNIKNVTARKIIVHKELFYKEEIDE